MNSFANMFAMKEETSINVHNWTYYMEQFIDKIEYQLDDDEQDYPTEQETYLYLVMLNELDFCKRNNEEYLLTSAIENAIMGSYSKPTKKKTVGKKPITKKGAKK